MGMYTECILGCLLKSETPDKVIETLKVLLEGGELPSEGVPEGDRISWMFRSDGSYYFGTQSGTRDFTFDEISQGWRLSARFNIKNYSMEIENFLEWLHPWIEQGSGERDFYAIVTYEEASEPTIYYLKDKEGNIQPFPKICQ